MEETARPKRNKTVRDFTEFFSESDEVDSDSSDDFVVNEESDELNDSDEETLAQIRSRNRANTNTDDSDDDDDDDIPLIHLAGKANLQSNVDENNNDSDCTNWISSSFVAPNVEFKGNTENSADENLSPYHFFKNFITDEMLEMVTQETNLYSMQKEGVELNTTANEIKVFIGTYLRMGIAKFHSLRAYWNADTRYSPVADNMSRNRFLNLLRLLHFCDNTEGNKNNEKAKDKLWKLRPWLNELRANFLKMPPEENNSVDEIMVPFKGKSSIKQYIRGKPNPWGFKLWARAGSSGVVYDFDVYQGKSESLKASNTCGVGGDVVMKMASTLPENENFKIFADNYFTSVALVKALKDKGIYYVGTVRSNRLHGCELKSEKVLKKEGRGSSDSKIDTSSNIVAVRWYNNKSVDLVSSFVGVEPMNNVRRWDKKQKAYVNINRPAIVEIYNKHMGGVDLLDSLVSLYKPRVKSRRWYMYIFWHTVVMAVVNAWSCYKRQCVSQRVKPVKLSTFVNTVADTLVKPPAVRLGRPALSALLCSPPRAVTNSKRRRVSAELRHDGIDHLPEYGEKRQRCRFSGCDGITYVKCPKCDVNLCFVRQKNCFRDYHT